MPAFFVFAIIFTVLMLEKRRALIVSLLEILLYMGLCLVAYHFPDTVTPFATITAAGKKHHRKNEKKDHDNGDQVAALIFSTVIGIKKKPSGDCNQRKIDQYISPGTGPETEKGHD